MEWGEGMLGGCGGLLETMSELDPIIINVAVPCLLEERTMKKKRMLDQGLSIKCLLIVHRIKQVVICVVRRSSCLLTWFP